MRNRAGGTASRPSKSPARPNILLILTDQEQNWTWLEDAAFGPDWPTGTLWGGYEKLLPNRLRLMRRGLNFSRYFTPTIACTPARSVIVTGRHTAETRMFDNVNLSIPVPPDGDPYYYQPSLRPYDETTGEGWMTVGQMLADGAGYYCAYKGKWHLTLPHEAEELGVATEPVTDPLGNSVMGFSLERYGFHDYQEWDIEGNEGTEGVACDPRIGELACAWLRDVGRAQNAEGRPWFLTVSFVNPHDINVYPQNALPAAGRQYVTSLPANHRDDLSKKPMAHTLWKTACALSFGRIVPHDPDRDWLNLRNNYIQYHVEVDAHIGGLLRALRRSGLEENTVVIFSADHGELGGAHGLHGKGPELYYESHSVPLTVVAPPSLPLARDWRRSAEGDQPFATTDALSSHLDLAPTLLAWAGLDGADYGLKGRDLTPVLTGEREQVREAVLFTNDNAQVWPFSMFTLDTTDNRIFSRGIFGYLNGKLYKYGRYFAPGRQATGPYEYELYDYATEGGRSETENLGHAWSSRAGVGKGAKVSRSRLDAWLDKLIVAEGERVAPNDSTGRPWPLPYAAQQSGVSPA